MSRGVFLESTNAKLHRDIDVGYQSAFLKIIVIVIIIIISE